jgi:long-chain acyl-CoA synthetase
MQVEAFLELSAIKYPAKVALVCGEERLSYIELDGQSNRLAHCMVEAGVVRGDRVVVCLPNRCETVLAIFAALKAGAAFVVVHHSTKAAKLTYILNDCRATALVTEDAKLEELASNTVDAPHIKVVFGVGVAQSCEVSCTRLRKRLVLLDSVRHDERVHWTPARQCIDLDLAALIYTSGSTGRPKGVMLSHLNLLSAATSITTYLENTSDDVVLNALPLSFDYGLYQVLMMFKVGGRVILERSFGYIHHILEQVVREGVTGLPIVPSVAALMLRTDLSRYCVPALRYITNTAAALPTDHVRELRRCFPNVAIYSMYGLTECKRVSYLPPEEIDRRPASVGRAMPNEEVYIVDDDGNRVGPGIVGELVVRGANVMKGYWELPEETDRVLKAGPLPGERVLYTGDLFRADEEGFLYFVGRRDEMIKTGGEKVSPREVEDAICAIPGVLEAAVVGVPDPVLGSAIKAVVSLTEGARVTRNQVLGRCRETLESFMVPKCVEFRAFLPKTESGKISKRLIGLT